MQWITIATPPFRAVEQFDKVRTEMGEEPEGMEARYVGTVDGEVRIVTVWESKAHADRFFNEKLGPALARALGPEPAGTPKTIGVEVARSYVREPVV
jgi:heme-degrading monooxygenase HmoA